MSGLVTLRPSEEDGQWCGGSRFSAELLGSFLNKDPELFNTDWVIAVLHADGVHDWQYSLREGCSCTDDLWKYDIQCQTWEFQPVTEVPIARYRQTTKMFQGALYFFGGESYTPYMFHNSVMRIDMNSLPKREL